MSALLTIQQAAERLGVSEDTFRAIVREGGIPRIRISERVVRYDPEDVAAYIERAKCRSGEMVDTGDLKSLR